SGSGRQRHSSWFQRQVFFVGSSLVIARRFAIGVCIIPLDCLSESILERSARFEPQGAKLGNIRTTPRRTTLAQFTSYNLNVEAKTTADLSSELFDRDLAIAADVIDAERFGLFHDPKRAIDCVINIDEGTGFFSGALNLKRRRAFFVFGQFAHSQRELRDNM